MPKADIAQWVAEPLSQEVRRAIERLARDDDVVRIAVMPDVHLSREVCVGVALATRTTLIPAAVGGDIGCGMAALAFDAPAACLSTASAAADVMAGLYEAVPVLRHRRSTGVRLAGALADHGLATSSLDATKAREAALQLGTLGRGNHFLELQSDEDGRLWLMVHSGSRGLGPAIRDAHEQVGTRNRAGLQVLQADSEAGRAYLADMQWALDYAQHSRDAIVDRVCELMHARFSIEPDADTRIACHHNFVRREVHEGEALWVHRKGAISARAGEPGIIPGSMGTSSFHVRGQGCAAALCSSAHGAGRTMSRSLARRAITGRALRDSMTGVWFDHRLASRLVEEAPAAYKDIGAVMRAQRELTRATRRLTPVLAFKGA